MPRYLGFHEGEWYSVFSEVDLGNCLNVGLKFKLAVMDGDVRTDNHLMVSDLREVVGDDGKCSTFITSCTENTRFAQSSSGYDKNCNKVAPKGPLPYYCDTKTGKTGSPCNNPSCIICCHTKSVPTPPPIPAKPTPPPPPTSKPCSSRTQQSTCESSSLITYSYTENLFSTASASGGPTPAPSPTPAPGPGIQCKWDNDNSKCCNASEYNGSVCEPIVAIWLSALTVKKTSNVLTNNLSSKINTLINFGGGDVGPNPVTPLNDPAQGWKYGIVAYMNPKLEYFKPFQSSSQITNLWLNIGGANAATTTAWEFYFNDLMSDSKLSDINIKYKYNGICIDWEFGSTGLPQNTEKFIDACHLNNLKVILVVAGWGPAPTNYDMSSFNLKFDHLMLMLYQSGGDSNQDQYSAANVTTYINAWSTPSSATSNTTTIVKPNTGTRLTITPFPKNKIIPCWSFGDNNYGDGTNVMNSVAKINPDIAYWVYYNVNKEKAYPGLDKIFSNFHT